MAAGKPAIAFSKKINDFTESGLVEMVIKEILVVEGKYDKIALSNMVDATILTTEGFGLFKNPRLRRLLARLARERGVIVLTDADGAGLVIRNYLNSFLPPGTVRHAYIPQREGKERRKAAPSKEKLLGVEGMDRETLLAALQKAGAAEQKNAPPRRPLTKADLYMWGLSGGVNSAIRRKALLEKLDLPRNLSSKALCEVLTMLYDKAQAEELVRSVDL